MKKLLYILASMCAAAVSCATSPAETKPKPAESSYFEMRLVESGSTDNDQKYKVRGSDEELALDEKVLFDQTDISSAAAVKNEYGAYVVEFQLTDDAAQRFSDLTERSIGKRLAIIVNGEVITAPVIQMQISGGKGQISAIGDEKEARAIAGKLSGK